MKWNLTGNPRAVQVLLLAVIVATLWFACTRDAGAAEPKFFAGGGMATSSTIPISSGLRFGIEQGPWQVSLNTHGESVVHRPEASYKLDANIGVCGTWHAQRKRLSLGWGACLWEHGDWSVGDEGIVGFDADQNLVTLDDDGVQLTAAIVLRRTFGARERFYFEASHSSNGGASHYNRGRNLVGGGARF